jgi:Reverse transcriptase (RNA-dependent DNA polymerase)/RNase H-like domain found in reverse transcriptase
MPVALVADPIEEQNKLGFIECYTTTDNALEHLFLRQKSKKKRHLSPITLGWVHSVTDSSATKDLKRLRVLWDTGCSKTLVNAKFLKNLVQTATSASTWSTKAGSFTTTHKCLARFTFPDLDQGKDIEWTVHVDPSSHKLSQYDMIIGRDLMEELGIDILFSEGVIRWNNSTIPMRDPAMLLDDNIDAFEQEIFSVHDPETIDAERIQQILDAKYSPADIEAVVESCPNLSGHEKTQLKTLLQEFEDLFDGSLGKWTMEPFDIELLPEAKPYHARPYPVPHSQEQKLREEVDRLVAVGVLRKVNRSEWGAPMFTISKKDNTLRSIADFREPNTRIKRKPFPIPKIQDMLYKLEGFMHATSLDLNMGYYHIELSRLASSYCTVVLPWGKYEYARLPMGLCNSPDIFQEKMSDLMTGLEYARAYIDDLLVLSSQDFNDHLQKLEVVLSRLRQAGLKINASKSFFCREELEYLGFWITRNGIQPLNKKVEAINNMAAPTNRRQLRRFIGMVNYYRDMWIRRSDTLAPLTALTSVNSKWEWTDIHQAAFDRMKTILARETVLAYPDFNQPFHLHTDASKYQLGSVISQNDKPIAFYS